MSSRRDARVRIHKLGSEADEALLEESILHWRKLGPEAAWNAIYDLLDLWFFARGLDPEAQRVDRARVEVHPVARRPETTEARLRG